jgi:peptidoglycan L-alanyl-D-glutamate endopeptidase CwlK
MIQMAFLPHYHSRNMENIAQLGDKTKAIVAKLYQYAIQEQINVLIYETIRTKEKQEQNVKNGASQTMRSYHIVGQALDFVIVNGSEADWNCYGKTDAQKFIKKAKALGMTWGGDWKTFKDKPHLQNSSIAYGADTFKTKGQQIALSSSTVVQPEKTVEKNTESSSTSTSSDSIILPSGVFSREKNGSTYSTDVKKIQSVLNAIWFKPGSIDGYFGADTEDALKRFQSVHLPYEIDGVYGPKTREKMLQVYKG